MADVRRDSFDETNRLVKVLFQTDKFVQEYELNEMQDNLRVLAYRTSAAVGRNGVDSGWVVAPTVNPNEVTITAGMLVLDGVVLRFTGTTTFSGFTTNPGPGARADTLYLRLREVEVGDLDPDPTLGEQSRRRQLEATFLVAEGVAVPASTGDPWMGGIQYYPLAATSRAAGVGVIGSVIHLFDLLPGRVCADLTEIVNGEVEQIHAGTLNRISASPLTSSPMTFVDGYAGVTGLSDSGGADDTAVPLFLGPFGESPAPTATPTSIVRVLNGRAVVTCGDGVTTWGDYNGVDALERAVAAFNTVGVAGTIHVKAGLYAVMAPLIPVADLHIKGEGFATLVQNGTVAGSIFAVTNVTLTVEDLAFECFAACPIAFDVNGGAFYLTRCNVVGTLLLEDLRDRAVLEHSFVTSISGYPVLRLRPAPVVTRKGSLRITRSKLTATGRTAILAFGGGVGYFGDVLVQDTALLLGTTDNTINPVRNRGLFTLDDGTTPALLDLVRFRGCTVYQNSTDNSHFLHQTVGLWESDGATATGSLLRQLEFLECVFWHTRNNVDVGAFLYDATQTPESSVLVRGCHVYMGMSVDPTPGFTPSRAAWTIRANAVRVEDLTYHYVPEVLYTSAFASAQGDALLDVSGTPGHPEVQVTLRDVRVHVEGGGAGGATRPDSWIYVATTGWTLVEGCRVEDDGTLTGDPATALVDLNVTEAKVLGCALDSNGACPSLFLSSAVQTNIAVFGNGTFDGVRTVIAPPASATHRGLDTINGGGLMGVFVNGQPMYHNAGNLIFP